LAADRCAFPGEECNNTEQCCTTINDKFVGGTVKCTNFKGGPKCAHSLPDIDKVKNCLPKGTVYHKHFWNMCCHPTRPGKVVYAQAIFGDKQNVKCPEDPDKIGFIPGDEEMLPVFSPEKKAEQPPVKKNDIVVNLSPTEKVLRVCRQAGENCTTDADCCVEISGQPVGGKSQCKSSICTQTIQEDEKKKFCFKAGTFFSKNYQNLCCTIPSKEVGSSKYCPYI